EIRLLRTTANIEETTGTHARITYVPAAGELYVCDGTILRRTDDPTASSPTWANDDPHAGDTAVTVEDVTHLGTTVYAALGVNGIHRKESGAAWAHWSDLNPAERVWGVKGRVVASDGPSLYEITSGGAAPTALHTLAPDETWQDVADGGSHILAAASDGYVYSFDTETGSMVLVAQSLFEGEVPTTVGQTQGVIGIGVKASNVGRLYIGILAENGQLVDLQLKKQWGEAGGSTERVPYDIFGTRENLYTAVADGTDTYLWRYDLATAGVSRNLTIEGASGAVHGIVRIDGKSFASVDGSGVWRETDTFASDGYLIGPLGDFFSAANKSWVGANLETGTLGQGRTVELYRTIDPDALNDVNSSSWVRVLRRDTGTGDTGTLPLQSVVARSLAGMVRLLPSSDRLSTPAVRSFSFSAYPATGDEDIIVTIPVNVSDQIERRGMSRRRIKGAGGDTYTTLLGFEGRPVTMRLFKPNMIVRGLVEEVSTPITSPGHRGSATVISQVTIRGRRIGQAGTTSGVGVFGTAHPFAEPPPFGSNRL
ncbi:MAG TPA: hypothetical protein VIG24_06490, partial [Acidimicrobiia bacterium]